MNIRRELFLLMGTLLVITLALAFGAIGLFVRMGPAIERIMEENVETMSAAEEILAELATPEPMRGDVRRRLEELLDHIEENISEDAERPLVADLRGQFTAALEGAGGERIQVARLLMRLGRVNRDAMFRVDEEARHLGNAGAWSAVFVGFLGFAIGLLALTRIATRFIEPLEDLDAVLSAAREGDSNRRCRTHFGPVELRRMAHSINALLDQRAIEARTAVDASSGHSLADAAVGVLLQRTGAPTCIVRRGGRIDRANEPMLALLGSDRGAAVRRSLHDTDTAPADWEVVDLPSVAAKLFVLPDHS